jgi:hypothetical protein
MNGGRSISPSPVASPLPVPVPVPVGEKRRASVDQAYASVNCLLLVASRARHDEMGRWGENESLGGCRVRFRTGDGGKPKRRGLKPGEG